MGIRLPKWVALILLVLCIPGCATPSPPKEDVKRVERAIADALDAGAAEHAPSELALARDKLSLARSLIEKGADRQAIGWLLEQSQVDAELAAARSIRVSLTR